MVEIRADHKFDLDRAVLADMQIDMNASVRNELVPELNVSTGP